MVNGAPTREVPKSAQWSPEGDLQYSTEGLHEYSRDLPRGSIHHDRPEGFSQIFILMDVLVLVPILRMRWPARSFLPSGASSAATVL